MVLVLVLILVLVSMIIQGVEIRNLSKNNISRVTLSEGRSVGRRIRIRIRTRK